MGQENKFSSRNKIQRAPKSFVCTQVGETNKIIIELDDQTKSKNVLSIEGKGGMCVFQFGLMIMHLLCQISLKSTYRQIFFLKNRIEANIAQFRPTI